MIKAISVYRKPMLNKCQQNIQYYEILFAKKGTKKYAMCFFYRAKIKYKSQRLNCYLNNNNSFICKISFFIINCVVAGDER